jgi:tetratricopeptide (TPR) repeat protein
VACSGSEKSSLSARSVLTRLRRGAAGIALAISCLLAAPLPAHAQRAGTASDTVALKHFEQGKQAYDGGRFEEALVAFQKSLALLPSPNTRLYIGRCFRALGKTASAYTHLRLASREAQDRLSASGEKRFTATRDAAAGEAAELEAKVPRLTIAVPGGVPDGFAVSLDDSELPRDAWGTAIETDPGAHTVKATGPRMKEFVERFELGEGEQKRVEVLAARVPTARVVFDFTTRPAGLAVSIDGKPIDSSLLDKIHELDVGQHRISARAPGYREFLWQKQLTDREEARVVVSLEPEPAQGASKLPPWLFYATAGASVVALGAGTYFAFSAQSLSDDEQAKDPLLRDRAAREEVGTRATTANVLFGAGVLLSAGAGVLYFMTDWGQKEVFAGVSPNGVVVGGRL